MEAVALMPAVITLAVVLELPVVTEAVVVALTFAAMTFAVVPEKSVVTAPAVIRSGLKRHIRQSTSLVLVPKQASFF